LARQLKKIEAEAKLKNEDKDKDPPLGALVEMQNENMILKSQLAKALEKIDSICNKPETR